MSIAKSFTHISVESINGEVSSTTLSNAKALDATLNTNTDIMIVQPANTRLTSVTLSNSGVTDISTNLVASDDLAMSIGYNDVGDAKDYSALMTERELINNGGAEQYNWEPNVRLAIINPGASSQYRAFNFPHSGFPVSLKKMISTDARELNFRFTPKQGNLATTSTVKVICEFQTL